MRDQTTSLTPPPPPPTTHSHKDADLTVGETACLDRCSAKYWATTGIVGQLLGGGAGPK